MRSAIATVTSGCRWRGRSTTSRTRRPRSALEAAYRRETDSEVRIGLIRALGAMGDGAVDALQRLVSSSDKEVRATAVAELAGGGASGPVALAAARASSVPLIQRCYAPAAA